MTEDNEYCEKHCKGYRDTGGRCFADGRCDAYWEYQQSRGNNQGNQSRGQVHDRSFERITRPVPMIAQLKIKEL
jgi:hypothetical protein